jgi:proline iminopeptidase
MAILQTNGIAVAYEDQGGPADPPLLLIMGLGMQLTAWPEALIEALLARRLRAIRFDNRDVGLSTAFDHERAPAPWAAYLKERMGLPVHTPYRLEDMAADALGLMDELGVGAAHVVGVSMGGMIAQVLAADHPARVATLTLMMTSSGSPHLPMARPDAMLALTASPPQHATREQVVDHFVRVFETLGSPGFPVPRAARRAQVERNLARAYRPAGTMRQLAAIIANGDRSRLLSRIRARTLVIHGADDPLVPAAHGRDLAARIPQARLALVPGLGHDLPDGALPRLAELIAGHVQDHDAAAATDPTIIGA